MKSIEALHDEALSLIPDTANNRGMSAPPAVMHTAALKSESPKDALEDTSANASSESAGDHDIMARIDHLLKKLDKDDALTIAPLADEGPQTNTENVTGPTGDIATADTIKINNLAKPDRSVLSNAEAHANENTTLDAAVDSIAEDGIHTPSSNTGDEATDDASDEVFADDQPKETAPTNQTQALADIATAIFSARQKVVDAVVTDASQNNTAPFDPDILSAAVADEVRRTVSAVIIAELPQMVRDAVGEAIRALPANVLGQSTTASGNPSTTKSVASRNTKSIKKTVEKKVRTKKAGTKKPTTKKATSNKASTKKTAPST